MIRLTRSLETAIDALIDSEVRRTGAGAAVGICRDGAMVLSQGYGLANLEWAASARPDTLFSLASISKPLTALAVMMLVEEGALALDTRIDAHLPPIAHALGPITVEHLLSHTSGLRGFNLMPGFAQGPAQRGAGATELLEHVLALPCDEAPGVRHRYSNSGYVLLSFLVEQVSGLSFGRFMRERLFAPLGMTRSRLLHDRAAPPGRAEGYQAGPQGIERASYLSLSWFRGAGALASTVNDMALLEGALHRGEVISPVLFEQMLQPTTMNDGSQFRYGLGWGVADYLGRPVHHHTGGLGGFRGEYCRLPADGLSVLVLANHADFPFHRTACALIRLLLGAPTIERAERPLTAADRATIAGVFTGEDGAVLSLVEASGCLSAPAAGIADLAMDEDGDLFDRDDPEVTLRLELNAGGRAVAVTLQTPMFAAQRFTASRSPKGDGHPPSR